jgi:hypothetical protein
MQTMLNIEQAKEYAAQHGVVLSAADMQKVTDAQIAESGRLEALKVGENISVGRLSKAVDDFNRLYPAFLAALVRIGDVLLTTSQTVIVAFGVPIVLVLLLVVEHQRVLHGIELFEVDAGLASFAAAALVITNLVLEFTIHYVEQQQGYEQERSIKWSFRRWSKQIGYAIGWGRDWKAQEHSPAQRYRKLLSLVTFSILALALAGSMRSVIDQQQGAWYEAMRAIVEESTLTEIMTWAGGLLFASAAVLSAQGLSRYVAMRCAEIVSDMKSSTATKNEPGSAHIEAAGASAIMAIVNGKIEQKKKRGGRAKKETGQADRPFGNTVPELVEEDTTPMTALESANGGENTGRK